MHDRSESFQLGTIPLGGRLMVRSRTDWRTAVISRINEEGVTISVASPKGRNYRLLKTRDHSINVSNGLYFLSSDAGESWNENFAGYDRRW